MGIRDTLVNGFARALGVNSPAKQGSIPLNDQDILNLQKAQENATQSANNLPPEWVTSTYAPGWPIQPMNQPVDGDGNGAFKPMVPREIDYPIAVNASLQPRTAYGLMPFAALKEAYETVAEVRLPVATLLREMMIFRPHLIDSDKGEIKNHPYEWMTTSPDRTVSWDVWMTRFLKSSLVFDAGSFYVEPDNHNGVRGLHYVDGSTLFIMVNENGQVPKPNETKMDEEVLKVYKQKAEDWLRRGKTLPTTTPAYAQVIKGTPFAWYDQNQIWYKPRSRRFDSPYGETAIEQAWAWILICANITGFELAHYREGNMPEGWIEGPENWSLERLALFEAAFNQRMSSGPAERMRSRWLPHGSAWHETKKPEFPQVLYDKASSTISLFFGVPPSEYGIVPGSGLGGSGFEQAMQSALFRMGLYPAKSYVENAFNEILLRAGVTDAILELGFPTAEMNPSDHKSNVIDMFSNGLITFNNALAQLGQDQIPGGDVHMVIQNGAAVILEQFLASGETAINPYEDDKKVAQPAAQPVTEKPQAVTEYVREEPATPTDNQLAEKMLDNRSILSGKTISIPARKDHLPKHPRDPKSRFAAKARLSSEEAERIVAELGIDLKQVSLEEFRAMVENEAVEHPSIVGDDMTVAGRIVADHLDKSFAKAGDQNGCMVALDLPEDIAKQLQDACKKILPPGADPLPLEQMHLTLFYLGEMTKLEFTQSRLLQACKEFARTHAPLGGMIGGIARFNGGGNVDKTALVALWDCPDLSQFRQELVEHLHAAGIDEVIDEGEEHGFIPHITIAYVPADTTLNGDFALAPIPLSFNELTVAWGEEWHHIPMQASQNIRKLLIPDLAKHCGVCPEDDEYYGAPVIRQGVFPYPDTFHANDVEVVVMTPDGLPSKPGLWKPEGGERDEMQSRIGGAQYVREEATYLLDRSLNFNLVPVAYVAMTDDGERGAVVYYTHNGTSPASIDGYAPQWIEMAGILDYIMCQLDRHGGNSITHPDDQERMILLDNGLSFPVTGDDSYSPFVDAIRGKPLSEQAQRLLLVCVNDVATWSDIERLIGKEAKDRAYARAVQLAENKTIPEAGVI